MKSSLLNAILLPLVIVVAAFFITFQFVDPPPPEEIIFTTGQTGGAYNSFAREYQRFLDTQGVDLILRVSEGSLENIANLQNGVASVGFVQGGTLVGRQADELESLGSLYFEPLWVFTRAGQVPETLNAFAGQTLWAGSEQSGTRSLVNALLKEAGIDAGVTFHTGGEQPDELLKSGEIDAVFMVMSPTSVKVQQLLRDPQLQLMSFDRARAFAKRLKYIRPVTLSRGMVDLQQDLPRQDKTLLAVTANLVVREDLHPALQDLLMQAMDAVHAEGSWFEDSGEFPRSDMAEIPLSAEAQRFYRYGPPLLQRYMPFRVASLIDRLKVMLLPLVVLMIPLMRIMPPIYTWRMRSKIYRWYQKLEQIDLAAARPEADSEALKSELVEIDREVLHLQVPLSFASQVYDLRQHIELVKRRLG